LKDFPPKRYAKGAQAADMLTQKRVRNDRLFISQKLYLISLLDVYQLLRNLKRTYAKNKQKDFHFEGAGCH
jgi:hypothetical protein